METKNIFYTLLLSLFSTISTYSQIKTITPELIVNIKGISEVQLSPNGNDIVFQSTRQRTDEEKPGSQWNEIWMLNIKDQIPFRFTTSDKSDRMPRWSPDGKYIAFLSNRNNETQIYLIPKDGGEAEKLTNVEGNISSFKWSPDGKKIAFTMLDPKTGVELDNENSGKDWIEVEKKFKYTRLYTYDISSKKIELISKSNHTIYDFDWSPDGKEFITIASDTPLTDHSYMFTKLMKLSANGGELKLFIKTEGKLSNVKWSRDGKIISYLGAVSLNDGFAGSLFVVSSSGGIPENLMKNMRETAIWSSWLPDNKILLVTIDRQDNNLYSIDIQNRKFIKLNTQNLYFNSVSVSSDGKILAFAANKWNSPNEIYYGKINEKFLKKLTNFNPQLNDITFSEQEVVKWKSLDGLDIEGILVKPVGYEKDKKYPLVVQVHGGPEAAYLNGWNCGYHNWAQQLAANGYAVFMPNYRGSIGRGPEFCMSDHKDLMGKEFEDIISGIDYLVKLGIVDSERVGIGGGSYGGLASAWGATYWSKKFKAAVVTMGITNWISFMGTTDIFWENTLVHWNLLMYDNYDFFWERSPIKHIKNANTPTLILHGKDDLRVPLGQSQELYTALKWKGVPVEFVIYPRAGHGMNEKKQQIDIMKRVQAWYDSFLK